jgi:pimeloyl-ACP methyl ester carboxylesterase
MTCEMEIGMNKRFLIRTGSVIAIVALLVAARSIRMAHWPVHVAPSPDWESMLSDLDVEREQFSVQSGNLRLEADLLIPSGGSDRKGAVVFSPGSGDALYQNYAKGLIETYVLEIFLERDMAVLLINKRGMGESDGNWVKNDFQGRSDDLYAGVQHLQDHPAIDRDRIGLIGHSQGGWIVNLTAAQHEDVAFFISLAGPVTTVEEQMEDVYENDFRFQGYTGDELAQRTERELSTSRFWASVGEVIPFGMFGFDAGIMGYDPRDAVRTVRSPGLFVFGEHDRLVPADANVERFNAILDGASPDHLTYATIPKATHCFRVTESICSTPNGAGDGPEVGPLSGELVTVLKNWLTGNGY